MINNIDRFFIAIPLSYDTRAVIFKSALAFEKVRKTKKDNLHITLKFLGEAGSGRTQELSDAIDEAVKDIPVFDLRVKGIYAFPHARAAKIIWAGIDEGNDLITGLFEKINRFTEKLGFPGEDREFIPHITFARTKEPVNIERKIRENDIEIKDTAKSVILYKSTLTQKGPEYSVVYERELKSKN